MMAASPATTVPGAPTRITSLDQFRGYTVAGMFLVNFIGSYAVTPAIFKHHNVFCSYADTIMPQFFFAVGFAFRLTFGRRIELDGAAAAYARVVRRLLGLILVALVVYTVKVRADTWQKLVEIGFWGAIQGPLKREWFQTLTHIAVTSLWILPVIRASAMIRIAYIILSAVLHVGLSYWFYFAWCHADPSVIDGGPLGFLTWSIPTLVGTLACDAVMTTQGPPRVARMILWSILLMGLGYIFSCGTRLYDVPRPRMSYIANQKLAPDPVWPARERFKERTWQSLLAEPPFAEPPGVYARKLNYWMMSQHAGTISYLTFSAGFSLFLYVLFYICCDRWGWQLGFFRTLGVNPLVGYILHGMVGQAVGRFMPKDAPEWYVASGTAIYFLIVYLFLRHLEKNKIFLRL